MLHSSITFSKGTVAMTQANKTSEAEERHFEELTLPGITTYSYSNCWFSGQW